MKKPFLLAATTAALLTAYPSFAQNTPAPDSVTRTVRPPLPTSPPPVKTLADSEFMKAVSTAAEEMGRSWNAPGSPREKADRLGRFHFSAATAGKLDAVLGPAQLLHIARKPRPGGVGYDIALDGFAHLDPVSGNKLAWAPLTANARFDRGYRHVTTAAAWPWLKYESGKGLEAVLNGLSYENDATQGPYNVWSGSGTVTIREGVLSTSGVRETGFTDLAIRSAVTPRARMLDFASSMTIGGITWGTESMGPLRYVFSVKNLDGKAFGEVVTAMGQADAKSKKTPAVQAGDMYKRMLTILTPASVFELDEFSVGYHGSTAVLSGRVGFDGAVAADFKEPSSLWKKIAAHFDLRVPLSFVNDVALVIVGRSISAQDPKADAASIAQSSQLAVDQMSLRLTGAKFIRIENDVVTTSLDYKNGQLTVNGQKLEIPGLGAGVKK